MNIMMKDRARGDDLIQETIRISNELETEIKDEDNVLAYYKDDGCLIVVFTNYTFNTDVEIYGYGVGKWFHPDFYCHIFTYAFKTLGCKRVTFKVEKDNEKCIKLLERANAVRECELSGIDMYLYSMLPENCEFIE